MTVKPESNFGRQIMKNLPHAQWTRIENRHGGGVPDLYGIRDGVSIWLELKCIKQNSINISPLQISWNYNHFKENGKTIILSVIRDQRSSNCTTATKGVNYTATGFVFHVPRNLNRHIIGKSSAINYSTAKEVGKRFLDRDQISRVSFHFLTAGFSRTG